jgi:DNA-binding CsgD family transcriptional regulator
MRQPPLLSRRQQEALLLIADGRTNREIAQALTISERTVKVHLRIIFQKLRVTCRADAVAAVQQEVSTSENGKLEHQQTSVPKPVSAGPLPPRVRVDPAPC